ncbi:unnamed protein product [Darwinula stevensoni]|uniref:Uncharacterized protein n=1 Tax=Darwinula stevensoni TaxID=69355 RepID=A0A7R9A760_9CRUS|nr:unnamed protein product [Darwinula stevensoni]CAG0891744.1 unnamed protein product [Darwinula stevensoni]
MRWELKFRDQKYFNTPISKKLCVSLLTERRIWGSRQIKALEGHRDLIRLEEHHQADEESSSPLRNRTASTMKAILALLAICAVVYSQRPQQPCCCDPEGDCDPIDCFDLCLDLYPDTIGICADPPDICWCFSQGSCKNETVIETKFVKTLKTKP